MLSPALYGLPTRASKKLPPVLNIPLIPFHIVLGSSWRIPLATVPSSLPNAGINLLVVKLPIAGSAVLTIQSPAGINTFSFKNGKALSVINGLR